MPKTKIEKVLKKWEKRISCGSGTSTEEIILTILGQIRSSIAGCSILEWHAAPAQPSKATTYLCRLDPEEIEDQMGPGASPFALIHYTISSYGSGFWVSSYRPLEWAELPEPPR